MQEHVRAVRVIYKLDFVDFRIFLVELKQLRRLLNAISLRLLLQKRTVFKAETWPVQNESTSIEYPVWFSNTEVSVCQK